MKTAATLAFLVGLLLAGPGAVLAQSCSLQVSLPTIIPDHAWQPDPRNPGELNPMMHLRLCNPTGCTAEPFLGLRLQAISLGIGNDLAHIDRVSIYLDTDCDGKPDGTEFAGGTYPADDGTANFCTTWSNPPVINPGQCLCLLVYYDMDECAPAGATFAFRLISALTKGCNTWAVNSQTYSAVKTVGDCCLYIEKHPNSPRNHDWTWSATDAVNEMLLLKLSNACCQEQLYVRCLKLRAFGTGDDAVDIDRIVLWEDRDCDGVFDAGETNVEYAAYPVDNGDVLLCPNYPVPPSTARCFGIGYKMKRTAPCAATYSFEVIDVQVTSEKGQTWCWAGVRLPLASATKTVYCPECCLEVMPGANPGDHIWQCIPGRPIEPNFMQHIKVYNPCPTTLAIFGLRLAAGGTGDEPAGVDSVTVRLDTDCDGNPDTGDVLSGSYTQNDGTVDLCAAAGPVYQLPPGQFVCFNIYYTMKCAAPPGTYFFDVVDIIGPNCLPACSIGLPLRSAVKTVESPLNPQDFGDAPDGPYPTLLGSDGARHTPGPMWLGPVIDAEYDGQPDWDATGDDFNDLADEDGVEFVTPLVPGEEAVVIVTANGPTAGMFLSAWIDFNFDGTWATAGDRIFAAQPLAPGANILTFLVPATADAYEISFARFRLHGSPNGLPFTGDGGVGEVEDYRVVVEMGGTSDLGDAPDSTNNYYASMTAYPPGGPPGVVANYPTVYYGSWPYGPIHWLPRDYAYLGRSVSLEYEADYGADQDGTNNLIPWSDQADLDGSDDGLILPLILPNCTPSSFQYIVTVVDPKVELYFNAWFDWDRDGDWDDMMECREGIVTEWAVQNQTLSFAAPGQYTVTSPRFLPWHLSEIASPLWVRLTLSEQPWRPSGQGGDGGSGPEGGYWVGETEDYYVAPETERLDWGDAPDTPDHPSFPTLAVNNGANHLIVPGFLLGAAIDGEPDGQPNPFASGDDFGGSDDEDGVAFLTPLIPGLTAQVQVTASAAGKLDAWVDFNYNRSWGDPGDKIFSGQPLAPGANILTFYVPDGPTVWTPHPTYSRFRLSSTGGLSYTGPAQDGEVEDHVVYVHQWPVEVTKGEAKLLPVGTRVLLRRNIVTANFGPDGWYFEEPALGIDAGPGSAGGRSAGIGVFMPGAGGPSAWGYWLPGDVVSCYGETYLNGCELMLLEVYSWQEGEAAPLGPLGQSNRASGGGEFGSQPGLMDDVGWMSSPEKAVGLNTVALLVTLWGRCTWIQTDPDDPSIQKNFWIDDGSALWDGTFTWFEEPAKGVKVRVPDDLVSPVRMGDYYSVTGIMRTDTVPYTGDCVRWLWPRSESDIVTRQSPPQ